MIDNTIVERLIQERKQLHPDDPAVVRKWNELTQVFIQDEESTIEYLNNCCKENLYWISEIFEDILGYFKSPEFIECIVECFYNRNGFYDDKWEMKYPHIVLEELDRFNGQILDTKNEEMIKRSQEILDRLKSFINNAMKRGYIIYVECS